MKNLPQKGQNVTLCKVSNLYRRAAVVGTGLFYALNNMRLPYGIVATEVDLPRIILHKF